MPRKFVEVFGERVHCVTCFGLRVGLLPDNGNAFPVLLTQNHNTGRAAIEPPGR